MVYAARQYRPLWSKNGQANAGALELIEALMAADRQGLDPARYPIERLQTFRRTSGVNRAADQAAWDILMSQALAAYAIDLRRGRADPGIVFTDPSLRPADLSVGEVLARAARAGSLTDYIDGLDELNPIYVRFRDALAHYRQDASRIEQIELGDGEFLQRGDRSPLVAQLHRRLGVKPVEDVEFFGPALERAVRDFQRASRLKTDGIVGRRTLALLNRSRADRIHTIIANMERARWFPRDMGKRFLLVDTAGFEVTLFEGGKQSDAMKVIVGKEYHRTPMFADRMEYVVVNPYWNVPHSILRDEIAPAVRREGIGYLQRKNMEVLTGWGGEARVIPASDVDWSTATGFRVRQRPGPGNALGQIKFMFPNKYAIYLHDTPAGHLFDRSKRAFSHGCVRVERPLDLADFVFRDNPDWDRSHVEQAIKSGERRKIDLRTLIPVYIAYFTAWPRLDGSIAFRADVYQRDQELKAQLASSG